MRAVHSIRKHQQSHSAQASADDMPLPRPDENASSSLSAHATNQQAASAGSAAAVSSTPEGSWRRQSWNPIKRNDSTGNEQSLKSLINAAGMGNMLGFSGSLPSSNEGQLDQIIPNFVSKQVRRVCYQMCAEVALKSEGSQEPLAVPRLVPSATEAFAAVVMVDVSGYSKLTAVLAERGPVGAELLTKTMKGYLDKIIQTIVTHGGDIVKFAGDAVIFCWKSEKATNLTDASQDKIRGELVYKASHCCLTLLTKLGTYDIDIDDCPTKILRIHLGIGAGLVYDVLVGGEPGRWEHFIAGDGVNQLSQVLDLAKAGELALSHQALKWLACVIDIATVNLGDYDKRCIILTGLEKAERKGHAPPDVEDEIVFKDARQMEANVDLYKLFVDRTALFKLQADINQSRLFQMDSGLLELLNLTELRQVTTIFIKVGSLQVVHRNDILDESQRAISIVQAALHRCEGSLRQFHVDDKGAVILCFFGLPPLAHENDAGLGIKAGIEIRDKFLDIFDDFSIGITTGVVSYGGVGALGRAEYAVMGDSINMAARLMCHVEAASGILCDEKTFNLCESDFTFENLGETKVKGKNSAISIFRPNTAVPESSKKNKVTKSVDAYAFIGRDKERKCILDAIERIDTDDTSDAIVIQADGGQGLSTLVGYAKTESIKHHAHVCIGNSVEMEKATPYFPWQSLVYDLVGLIESGSYDEKNSFGVPPPTISIQDLQQGEMPLTPIMPSPIADALVVKRENKAKEASSLKIDDLPPLPDKQDSVPLYNDASAGTPAVDDDRDMVNGVQSLAIPEIEITARVSQTEPFPGSEAAQTPLKNPSLAKLRPPGLLLPNASDNGSGNKGADSNPMSPVVTTPAGTQQATPVQSHTPSKPRRMSVLKSDMDSDEYLDGGQGGRVRHMSALAQQNEMTPESDGPQPGSFQARLGLALAKINENPDDAALFEIVMPEKDEELDPDVQTGARVRIRQLCNVLARVIATLSETNKLVIIMNEAQWMDTMSWELLLEILSSCSKVCVFIFTRPEGSYESKENMNYLRRIEHLPRTTTLTVEGLTLEETQQLIIAAWTGNAISKVSSKIVESIYKRTDGNPFFIRSLTAAMKDSGQWRMTPDGTLTTPNGDFDYEQLVLGYDNQSLILAQFDRLDRNFQLFLKVAAVLGQRFLLDDVLFFLTGMASVYEQIDRKNYSQIIRGVQATDKYGFLQRENTTPEGVHFQFKSAVVRKCIYSMMVHKQRQRLHQHVGTYYETRLNDSNRHRYLIPIFEHFMEADATQTRKKIHYLEMVANYYYERGSMDDSIKFYRQLLDIAGLFRKDLPEGMDFKNSTVANWHRELGHALFIKEELVEAEKNLTEALRLYASPLPESRFRISWQMRKQLRIRQQREANYFQQLQAKGGGGGGNGGGNGGSAAGSPGGAGAGAAGGDEKMDYTHCYRSPRSLSSYSLNNLVTSASRRADLSTSTNQAAMSAGGAGGSGGGGAGGPLVASTMNAMAPPTSGGMANAGGSFGTSSVHGSMSGNAMLSSSIPTAPSVLVGASGIAAPGTSTALVTAGTLGVVTATAPASGAGSGSAIAGGAPGTATGPGSQNASAGAIPTTTDSGDGLPAQQSLQPHSTPAAALHAQLQLQSQSQPTPTQSQQATPHQQLSAHQHPRISQNMHHSSSASKHTTKDRNTSQSLMRDTSVMRQTPAHGIQHVLLVLADLYHRIGDFPRHQLCVLMGLNMAQDTHHEPMLARFFSFGSIMLWTAQIRPQMSIAYIEAADKLDNRADIYTSIQIVANQSLLLFYMGRWENALKSLDSWNYLGSLAGDVYSRLRALSLRATIQGYGVSRPLALITSRELYAFAIQKESWLGRFWGCYLIMENLLSSPEPVAELQDLVKQFDEIWTTRPASQPSTPGQLVAYDGLRLLVRIHLGHDVAVHTDLASFAQIVSKPLVHPLNLFQGILCYAFVLFSAYEKHQLDDGPNRKLVDSLCAKTNRTLKTMKGLVCADPTRRIFKGMRLLLAKQRPKAVAAWQKGLTDTKSEALIVQAFLQVLVAQYSDPPGPASTAAAESAKATLKRLQATQEFEKIWVNL